MCADCVKTPFRRAYKNTYLVAPFECLNLSACIDFWALLSWPDSTPRAFENLASFWCGERFYNVCKTGIYVDTYVWRKELVNVWYYRAQSTHIMRPDRLLSTYLLPRWRGARLVARDSRSADVTFTGAVRRETPFSRQAEKCSAKRLRSPDLLREKETKRREDWFTLFSWLYNAALSRRNPRPQYIQYTHLDRRAVTINFNCKTSASAAGQQSIDKQLSFIKEKEKNHI